MPLYPKELTPPAPSDAEARENLRRIGEVARRFRHTPPGGWGGQAGDVEVLGTFTGSAMGEVEVD